MTKLTAGMTRFQDALVEQLHFADVDRGLPHDKTLLMLVYKKDGILGVMKMPEVQALAEAHSIRSHDLEHEIVRAVKMVQT